MVEGGDFHVVFPVSKKSSVHSNLGLEDFAIRLVRNQSCSSSSIFWGASYNDFWASTC